MDVKSTLLALLCGAMAFAAQAAQVYKWVDPSGRAHYSDTPRQGWQAVDLDGESTAPEAATTDAGAGEDNAEEATGATESAEPASATESTDAAGASEADARSRQQLRAEECKRAKDQLDSYKNAPRIVERDAQGKDKVYSSEERLQLLEQTQKRVRDYCGTASQ